MNSMMAIYVLTAVPMSDTTDVVADLVIDVGSIAAAVMTIGGLIMAVFTLLLRRIQSMVDAATEPLRTDSNGDIIDPTKHRIRGLADLPAKMDDVLHRLTRVEERLDDRDNRG